MRTHDSDADDVELDEMESDAFLPSEQSQRSAHALKSSKQSPLTRWIPRRIRMVFENISRLRVRVTSQTGEVVCDRSGIGRKKADLCMRHVQLMIILLSIFLIMFAVMVFFNNRPIHIPSASIKLSEALAIELSGTAIPDYVLTYGTPLTSLISLKNMTEEQKQHPLSTSPNPTTSSLPTSPTT